MSYNSMRVLSFPHGRTLGWLYLAKENIVLGKHNSHWQYHGEASGDVNIPPGYDVRLVMGSPDSVQELPGGQHSVSLLRQLLSLKREDIQSLALTGISEHLYEPITPYIFHLQHLYDLSLHGAHLTNYDFDSLSHFPRLETLELSSTNLVDDNIKQLTQLQSLRELFLINTHLTGRGIDYLSDLPSLEVVNLECTELNDEDLRNLSKCKKLRGLSIRGQRFTDASIQYLADIRSLEELNLYETAHSDHGLNRLLSFENLRCLTLEKFNIGNKAFCGVAQSNQLETLILSECALSNTASDCMSKFYHLRQLLAYGTSFDIDDHHDLSGLDALVELTLSGATISDDTVTKFKYPITMFSIDLSGSLITDKALEYLIGFAGISHFDLSDTNVSIQGLTRLIEHQSTQVVVIAQTVALMEIEQLKRIRSDIQIQVE